MMHFLILKGSVRIYQQATALSPQGIQEYTYCISICLSVRNILSSLCTQPNEYFPYAHESIHAYSIPIEDKHKYSI
jgi:hypothetical protein